MYIISAIGILVKENVVNALLTNEGFRVIITMLTNGVRICEQKGGRMHLPTMRVLRILDSVANDSGGKRLSDFSRDLQIPKSTLLPILQTLTDCHYLNQNENGRYTAGTALFSLGATFSGCFPILEYVRDQLTELVDKVGETFYCGVLSEGYVLYLEKVDSPQPLRVLTSTGRRLPAYASSIGKALLLEKTEQELQQMYPNGLAPLTGNTITDIAVLHKQLCDSRSEDYTWECEESTEHVRCFATPIRKHGQIVAAISVAIPLFRYHEEQKQQIIALLQEYASVIGRMIEKTDAHFGESF